MYDYTFGDYGKKEVDVLIDQSGDQLEILTEGGSSSLSLSRFRDVPAYQQVQDIHEKIFGTIAIKDGAKIHFTTSANKAISDIANANSHRFANRNKKGSLIKMRGKDPA